ADITVVDRGTGQTLPVYRHQGRFWVAGQPGRNFAVRVHNRSGGRLLSVISIDGVNIISGETAGTGQSGYVLSPWERYDLTGWRKSEAQVAAFYFTALPDSYAARTGRPDDVGVIGVALFREKPPAVSGVAPRPVPFGRRDNSGASADARERAEAPAPGAAAAEGVAASKSAPSADAAPGESRAARAPAAPKLGTGHGQREHAPIETTTFERARETPDEVVVIHYDSRANLVAMGVIREPAPLPRPRPFPGQPEVGYAPDPPRGW
ncbi:MAG: hypothetical protein JNM90_25115, partial [Burkholderiales bacterium]|nr:hypothetical protein [Burkholderiales bacterium]